MSLTIPQLKSLSFGYLCGADLLKYAAFQLLQRQYEIDNNCFQSSCSTIYNYGISQLSNRYDVATELQKVAFVPAVATAAFDPTGGTVTAITVNYGGTNYKTVPNVIITGGGGSGATATAVLTNGVVTAVNITNAGTGYNSIPGITFSNTYNAATGNATIDPLQNIITAINVINGGTGYITPPTVVINGGNGECAEATAVLTGGVVTSVIITNHGKGFTTVPTIIFYTPVGPDNRSTELVRILATLAVQNILQNLSNISSDMTTMFTSAKKDIMNIRTAQANLPLNAAPRETMAGAQLISDSFSTLG